MKEIREITELLNCILGIEIQILEILERINRK